MSEPPSVCVVGTGAIGGLLGGALAAKGLEVTFVDRGSRLADLRQNGLRVIDSDGNRTVINNARFVDANAVIEPFDIVLLGVKAHQIAELVPCLQRLVGDDTALLTLQNGLPWWYFQGCEGEYRGSRLHSLDPDGSITAAIAPERIVGVVVYPAAEVLADGSVRHVEGDRFALGEPGSDRTGRVQRLADLISDAGFRGQVQPDIRAEIWLKSWGSLAFNSVSALTRSTMAEICRDAATKALVKELMLETEAVANALGISMRVSLERRLAGAETVGEHKTSTLQDVEAGRPIEVEALIGSVLEIAELTEIRMPKARAVYAMVRLLNDRLIKQRQE